MFRTLKLALPLLFLAGCATGYVIDRLRPKTYLVGPQLVRYGLDPDQAQCAGASLSKALDVWQMRQLADAARAARGDAELTPRHLAWYASQVKDAKVAAALDRALADCGVSTAAQPQITIIEGDLPPPDGVVAARTGPTNGPADYAPSDDLWAALQAHEKGDFATAARLSQIAADAGDSGAQQFLGGLYAFGQGVAKSPVEAARYYARAAEQGWSEAMVNLGKAYETGEGVPTDPVEALKWYLLASARPTENPELVQGNIRNVSGGLSVTQIEQAAALARAWEQAHRR